MAISTIKGQAILTYTGNGSANLQTQSSELTAYAGGTMPTLAKQVDNGVAKSYLTDAEIPILYTLTTYADTGFTALTADAITITDQYMNNGLTPGSPIVVKINGTEVTGSGASFANSVLSIPTAALNAAGFTAGSVLTVAFNVMATSPQASSVLGNVSTLVFKTTDGTLTPDAVSLDATVTGQGAITQSATLIVTLTSAQTGKYVFDGTDNIVYTITITGNTNNNSSTIAAGAAVLVLDTNIGTPVLSGADAASFTFNSTTNAIEVANDITIADQDSVTVTVTGDYPKA